MGRVGNQTKAWLLCLAVFYPLYFLVTSVLNAGPALARVAFFGHELRRIDVWELGVLAASGPRGAVVPVARNSPIDFAIAAVVVLVVFAIVARRNALAGGLGVALAGTIGLEQWGIRAIFLGRSLSAANAVLLVFCAGLLLAGLRWMLAGSDLNGYWRRVAQLVAMFVIPLAAIEWLFAGRRWFRWQMMAIELAPAVVAALLVSLRKPAARPATHTWRAIAAGIVATALVVTGADWGRTALHEARESEARNVLAALPKPAPDLPFPKLFFQKGVSFTAEGGTGYESASARRMLEELPKFGVDAIALVPYGRMMRNPLRIAVNNDLRSWENDMGIEILTALAHQRGMKVMLKPHLWSPGERDLSSAGERAEWFAQFGNFLEHYARLAQKIHTDILCVGVELGWLARYDADWRNVIRRVRSLYPGPLVYAANFGPEFESITFWDALDYIGLNNYYPLPDDYSTGEIVGKVEAVQERFQRPVLFTEAGFSSAAGAHREPWADRTGNALSLEEQARCYEAVLRAFYDKPWFYGVYWWKVGTNGFGGPEDNSMTPWRKPAMDVVARWYGKRRVWGEESR